MIFRHVGEEAAQERPESARERLDEPGEYLAYEDGETLKTVALTREWTRIGRSLAADVRFDDPTVSRRHALIVRQADGVRVLDDRSLNGVFVNGSRIEWKVLKDGDEILVGRYRLRFLSIASQPSGATATTGQRRVTNALFCQTTDRKARGSRQWLPLTGPGGTLQFGSRLPEVTYRKEVRGTMPDDPRESLEAVRLEKLERIANLGVDPWGQRFDGHLAISNARALATELARDTGDDQPVLLWH